MTCQATPFSSPGAVSTSAGFDFFRLDLRGTALLLGGVWLSDGGKSCKGVQAMVIPDQRWPDQGRKSIKQENYRERKDLLKGLDM